MTKNKPNLVVWFDEYKEYPSVKKALGICEYYDEICEYYVPAKAILDSYHRVWYESSTSSSAVWIEMITIERRGFE